MNQCLNCGMSVTDSAKRCPKCDNRLDLQTDGSTETVDIAHQGERVRDAIGKLHQVVKEAKSGVSQQLRIIVGSGVIREEAMVTLAELEHRRSIIQFDIEPGNPGAILIRLKP